MTRREEIWRALLAAGGSAPIGWIAKSFGISPGAAFSTLNDLRRDGCVVRTGDHKNSRWVAVPHRQPIDGRGKAPGTQERYWGAGNVPWNKDRQVPTRKKPRKPIEEQGGTLWTLWRPQAFSPIAIDTQIGDNFSREGAPAESEAA